MVRDNASLPGIVISCWARKKKKKRTREWCKPWLERRNSFCSCNQLFNELQCEDPSEFENHTRLPISSFFWLLNKISNAIKKEDTAMRRSISPAARLEATLIFLATGTAYNRLRFTPRISTSSISYIIPETCHAIYDVLKEDFLKVCYLFQYTFLMIFLPSNVRFIYLHS